MPLDPEYFQSLYDETRIIRRPTLGIHSGYHNLEYILLGESEVPGFRTTEIRGKILVSPKIIVRPGDATPTYGEVFDADSMADAIVGRMFAFKYRRNPVELQQDDFSRREFEVGLSDMVNRVLDELERREIITMGVIHTPKIEYYPVSLDKFITSVLDQEFA